MRDGVEKEWMDKLSDRAEVIGLIQGILGCGCPMEVFEDIQKEMIKTDHMAMLQLILGNRLLVWIVDAMKMGRPDDSISKLLEQGRLERDRRNLNRFRLVVVGGFSERVAKGLQALSETEHDRVHLHVLPQL